MDSLFLRRQRARLKLQKTAVIEVGIALAKQVFQPHGVDSHEQVACRKQLKRSQVLDFFRRLKPGTMAMEACGSAHYWLDLAPRQHSSDGKECLGSITKRGGAPY